MSRLTSSVVLYLGLVFLAGVGVGAFGYRLAFPPKPGPPARLAPEEYRRQFIGEMKSRVNLTATQIEQLESILDQTRAEFMAMRERGRTEMAAIQQRQVDSIKAILSPEQQSAYDQLRQEREERRRRERKDAPRDGPPR